MLKVEKGSSDAEDTGTGESDEVDNGDGDDHPRSDGEDQWEASRLRSENERLRTVLAETQALLALQARDGAPALAESPPFATVGRLKHAHCFAAGQRISQRHTSANLRAEELVSRIVKRTLFPRREFANPIRRAWLRGELDWHNLVRPAPTLAPGADPAAVLKRFYREAAKADLITLLQGYGPVTGEVTSRVRGASDGGGGDGGAAAGDEPLDEASLRAFRSPTSNHGPLAKYAACGVVRDKCLVHSSARACVEDELCGWCASTRVCLDRFPAAAYWPEPEAGSRVRSCPGALHVVRRSVPSEYWSWALGNDGNSVGERRRPVVYEVGSGPTTDRWRKLTALNSSDGSAGAASWMLPNCSVVITRRRALLLSQSGDAKMSYHFWTQASPAWFAYASSGDGLDHLRQHVWIDEKSQSEHLHLTHMFSDSCHRSVTEVPHGVRICYASHNTAPNLPLDNTPETTAIDHATGAVLEDQPGISLEPLAVAVARGYRLGVSGMASLIFRINVSDATGDELAQLADGEQAKVSDAAASLASAFKLTARASFPGFIVYGLGLWDVYPSHVASSDHPDGQVDKSSSRDDSGSYRPRPLVALLSRRNKRFLMNEPQIVQALLRLQGGSALWEQGAGETGRAPAGTSQVVHPWGPPQLALSESQAGAPTESCDGTEARVRTCGRALDVEVATLEDMPLYEQTALFRRASVLVGVHGSGLVNSLFMHPGTALLQIMPRGVTTGAAFFQGPAASAGVHYFELMQRVRAAEAPSAPSNNGTSGSDQTDAESGLTQDVVFDADDIDLEASSDVNHWHFLDRSYASRREEVLARGSEGHSQAVFFSFFINRDMSFPPSQLAQEVARALRTAVLRSAAAPAAARAVELELEDVDKSALAVDIETSTSTSYM